MSDTTYIIASLLNAAMVAMLALAYHEMIRPGKILGWWVKWLWKVNDKPCVIRWHRLYSALTYTLRGECFACLGGQLGVVYYLLLIDVPASASGLASMALFIAPCILFTYPLNKLFQWQ